jgi:hypothetical protein
MTCEDKINETGHGYHNPAPSTLNNRDNNKITREQSLFADKSFLTWLSSNRYLWIVVLLQSSQLSKFLSLNFLKIYVVDANHAIFLNF